MGGTFDEPTLCDAIPPAGVRSTERTWQHKSSKVDIDERSQEQTRICSSESTLWRKVRRSAGHFCTSLLVPELSAQVRHRLVIEINEV